MNNRPLVILPWILGLITIFGYCFPTMLFSQNKKPIQEIARTIKDSNFQQVFHHPEKYRLQIIYTQIDRDKYNRPHFTTYRYHSAAKYYFNPASTVKMPLAFLALEKLHALDSKVKLLGITKHTTMLTDSSYIGENAVVTDSTSKTGLPSLAQYIKRIFLVSDNDAYNRLYEFLGQGYINKRLHAKGYLHSLITRRFAPASEDQNRHTNAVRFVDSANQLQYLQPPAYNKDSFQFEATVKIGNGYMNSKDSLINGPWDFTRGNRMSLEDLTTIERSFLFPTSVPITQRFDLDSSDTRFLLQYMSQYPGETQYPKYDSTVFFDSFTKFYFRYGNHHIPNYIRIFNKPGWSYGFLTDIAYIVDFKHKVEFMLSCTLYVNEDGIINDGHYDYDSIGFPFLYTLGQGIYQFELKRPRKFAPDLSHFKVNYEKRNSLDTRPFINQAAN